MKKTVLIMWLSFALVGCNAAVKKDEMPAEAVDSVAMTPLEEAIKVEPNEVAVEVKTIGAGEVEVNLSKPQVNEVTHNLKKMENKEVTELQKEIILEGKGDEAKKGDQLKMHYTGTLTDGSKFDSSVDRGQPFGFTLGAGQVIQGWDEGIVGMKVGEKRKLTIPYQMAYGEMGMPPVIPAKATLIFDVELLEIVK